MKGTIIKTERGWEVINVQATLNGPLLQSLPLHPNDVKQIAEWSQIFDNIEGRIASSPEVEFEIITSIPSSLEPTDGTTFPFDAIHYAKLIHDATDLKFYEEEFVPGLDKKTLDELFDAHDPEDFINEDSEDLERASLEDFIDKGNDNGWIKDYIEIGLEDEVLIELEEWDHTCGDGCCYTYGVNIYINGDQIEDEDGTNSHQLLKAVLTKLGYTNVRVEYK